MRLFKKRPTSVPDRASNPARRPSIPSSDDWLSSAAQTYKATPEGKAATAKVEGQIAMDAWRSKTEKARSAANAEAVANLKPTPKRKEREKVAEHGFSSERI